MIDFRAIFLVSILIAFLGQTAIVVFLYFRADYWRRQARYLEPFKQAFWRGESWRDLEPKLLDEMRKVAPTGSNGKAKHVS